MSASETSSAIFVTDTPKEIDSKVKRYAFSGGRDTREEQEKYGANLEVDVSYQWLRFLLEDDAEIERIGADYGAGRMLTGEIKATLVAVLTELVGAHQRARSAVTEDVVDAFMSVRQMPSLFAGMEQRRAEAAAKRGA